MATIVENLTNPGQPPAEGDTIRITYDHGTVVEMTYHEPVPYVPSNLLSGDDFKARLTLQEKQWLGKKSREATTPGPQIKDFLDAMNLLGAIDVTDPDVVSGFQWLVDNGILTSDRRDEILAPL